ncbi:MAG: pyruvate, water dikinase regulatory protein [Syntrophomonadaceae bacterium]|jgi:regulator of PEP synthase PpsR (kinase-PPPase family)|nr:kinase/pyrophosphorylase [Syntrophomonadaceae bacterium]MDH7496850.1 pyruvate, water dikinase regulatory protein [Syntrophomonadaceae bacterium]
MKELNIFAVSDSLGETAERIAVASALQFNISRNLTRFSRIVKKEQLDEVLRKARDADAIVVYTIVIPALSDYMKKTAEEMGVVAIDVLQPLLDAIQAKTGEEPARITGLTHKMDERYFNRMTAIEFTLAHDNGQNLDTIKDADLIILGLPRTSKTPLSMYLANLGLKVANYPIGRDGQIPPEILELKGIKPMVGLDIDLESLLEMKRDIAHTFQPPLDLEAIDDELQEVLENAYRVFARLKCEVINVATRDIEETANIIMEKFAFRIKLAHVRPTD